MTFLGVLWASCGRIWTKIGGNQAEALRDLPMQPRNLDFERTANKIAKEIWNKFAEQLSMSVFTPPQPGRRKTGQNAGNPRA